MTTRSELLKLQRHWQPPDGLDRSRPREVRLNGRGRALVVSSFVLLAAGLITGAALQAWLARERADLRLLRAEGVVTEARITGLWRHGGKNRSYHVAYRFLAAGIWNERSLRVSAGFWKRLHDGDALAVRYLPSRPAESRPAELLSRSIPQILPIAAALSLCLFGGLCWLPLARQRRLLAEGRAARAVVTRHRKDQHGTVVSYEFATLGGSLAKGKTSPQRKPQAIGMTLCVLYDSDRPARNAPYPLSLVRPFWGALRS